MEIIKCKVVCISVSDNIDCKRHYILIRFLWEWVWWEFRLRLLLSIYVKWGKNVRNKYCSLFVIMLLCKRSSYPEKTHTTSYKVIPSQQEGLQVTKQEDHHQDSTTLNTHFRTYDALYCHSLNKRGCSQVWEYGYSTCFFLRRLFQGWERPRPVSSCLVYNMALI